MKIFKLFIYITLFPQFFFLLGCEKDEFYGENDDYNVQKNREGDLIITRDGQKIISLNLKNEYVSVEILQPHGSKSKIYSPSQEISDRYVYSSIEIRLPDGSVETHFIGDIRGVDNSDVNKGLIWGNAYHAADGKNGLDLDYKFLGE